MSETQYLLAIAGGLFTLFACMVALLYNKMDRSQHAVRNDVNAVRLEVAEIRGTLRERNETLTLIREMVSRHRKTDE